MRDDGKLKTLIPLTLICAVSLAIKLDGLGDVSFWINEADNTRLYYFDSQRERLAWGPSPIGIGLHTVVYLLVTDMIPQNIILETEAGFRIPAVVFSVIGIPLVFLLARRFFSPGIAFGVTILWALNPFGFYLSRMFYSYSSWTVYSLAAVLAFFHLTDAVNRKRVRIRDWMIFHSVMVVVISTNVFVILVMLCMIPYFVASVINSIESPRQRFRTILASLGPHIPVCILVSLRAMDGKVRRGGDSWMSPAPSNPLVDLLELSFPSPRSVIAYIIIVFVIANLIRIFSSVDKIRPVNNRAILNVLTDDRLPVLLAGIAQPCAFLLLGLLGSPSWEHRYMGHLIPIWQISAVSLIVPKGFELGIDADFQSFKQVIPICILAILVSSSAYSFYQIRVERMPIIQDVRATMEFIDAEWDDESSNAVLTQPSTQIYEYYLERYELSPSVFEGSWGALETSTVDAVLVSEPDFIYRVRMVEFEDTESFISSLSNNYEVVEERRPTGMVVQKWVRSEA